MRTALVVDDSFIIRKVVSDALKEENFEVATAEDGQEALKVARGKIFDVIITDLNMPNMDGFELIENLRATEEFKLTPILVLSTEGREDKKEKGRRLGATDWLVKPFNRQILLAAINKVCKIS